MTGKTRALIRNEALASPPCKGPVTVTFVDLMLLVHFMNCIGLFARCMQDHAFSRPIEPSRLVMILKKDISNLVKCFILSLQGYVLFTQKCLWFCSVLNAVLRTDSLVTSLGYLDIKTVGRKREGERYIERERDRKRFSLVISGNSTA